MRGRSLWMRSAAVALVIALSAFLFVIGKGHKVYIDTHAITIEGVEKRAPDFSSITIDALPAEEMGRAERVELLIAGPRHKIRIESMAGDGKIVEYAFTVPTSMESIVLSVPAVLAGAHDLVLRPFVYGE